MPSVEAYKEQMGAPYCGRPRAANEAAILAFTAALLRRTRAWGFLFWAQNDPDCIWVENLAEGRRKFLLHWAVYDSQVNLPVVYLMELEDSGRNALPKDQYRWPEVQTHLMGQALAGLKLLTIAKGFDEAFDDLHPKSLRRFHLGPMYSNGYTRQSGPLHDVLAEGEGT